MKLFLQISPTINRIIWQGRKPCKCWSWQRQRKQPNSQGVSSQCLTTLSQESANMFISWNIILPWEFWEVGYFVSARQWNPLKPLRIRMPIQISSVFWFEPKLFPHYICDHISPWRLLRYSLHLLLHLLKLIKLRSVLRLRRSCLLILNMRWLPRPEIPEYNSKQNVH